MIREDKYVVFKIADAKKYLNFNENKQLIGLLKEMDRGRLADGRVLHRYVVVADTWPEYKPVWKMLEDRVDRESIIYS